MAPYGDTGCADAPLSCEGTAGDERDRFDWVTNQDEAVPSSDREHGESVEEAPRSRIVAAAAALLAEQGFEAASIKAIAGEAGVAPGLVHYYFSSKEELLVEVVQRAHVRVGRQMAALRDSGGDVDAVVADAFTRTAQRVTDDPAFYRLRYELYALGLRRPQLRDAVAALLRSNRDGIAATVRRVSEPGPAAADPPGTAESPPPTAASGDAEALAAVIVACFDGLALQSLLDPDFDHRAAFAVLGELLVTALPDPAP